MVEEGKGWRESAAKEEDLQLGGFIHRVSGHHSEKDWGLPPEGHGGPNFHRMFQDPRSRLLREMQLGCFLLARATWPDQLWDAPDQFKR